MSNKVLRLTILVLQSVFLLAIVAIAIIGIITAQDYRTATMFAESLCRCVVTVAFTTYYYLSFAKNPNTTGMFFPLYLLMSLATEIRIVDDFAKLNNTILIPPHITVYIFVFSSLVMVISLMGYGIFYQSNNTAANLYLLAGIVFSLLITTIIPKAPDADNVWDSTPLYLLEMSLFIIAMVIHLILLITETPGPYRVRHAVLFLIVVGNYLNLFHDTLPTTMAGTAIITVALLIAIIIAKVRDVRL